MTKRYNKPVYSEETYRQWGEASKKSYEFAKKHTKEIEKNYKVNGLYIFTTSREYDECMNKENHYIVAVWETPERLDLSKCLSHKVFDNKEEANKWFKLMVDQCRM